MNRHELQSIVTDLETALATINGASGQLTAREIRLKSLIGVAESEAMQILSEMHPDPGSDAIGRSADDGVTALDVG